MSRAPDATRREGRSSLGTIGLLSLLFALTRLPGLGDLPAFLDEAVHIQWAERLLNEGRVAKPVSAGRLLAVVAYGGAVPFENRLLTARFIAASAGALAVAVGMTDFLDP